MTAPDLGFVHRVEPPSDPGAPTLLLLHGTGGNENDLIPLAKLLAPRAGILSPRGQVLEQGMPRFFRRLSEGVFDLDDLRRRTGDLAEFVTVATKHYGIDGRHVIAVGFSNGANIAASLLLLRPGLLSGAILLRAMVPLVPDPLPRLPQTPVLLSNGRHDPLVTPEETERLADLLTRAGAEVTMAWQAGGHEATRSDVIVSREWLESRTISTP
jgi:phospholipase/carboxylesterase/glyoxalase family protein